MVKRVLFRANLLDNLIKISLKFIWMRIKHAGIIRVARECRSHHVSFYFKVFILGRFNTVGWADIILGIP